MQPDERTRMEREQKQRKEKFLMFTRVLMKYLEQKDPQMHLRAKGVIKTCAEKNKNKDPEYASLTQSMQRELKATVGEAYWKKADDYLTHFLKQVSCYSTSITISNLTISIERPAQTQRTSKCPSEKPTAQCIIILK